jgi:hypothetical protein
MALSGILLVVFALFRIFAHTENTATDLAAVLGIAQLVVLGRLVGRHQVARLVGITLALVEALFGVVVLATARSAYGLIAIVFAGFVVMPLATNEAEEYFEAVP